MKVSKAVITAAGFGSRFLPFVKNIPKEMLPLIDKPSIQYLVEECKEAGIEEVIIVTRDQHSLIEDYFTKPAPDVKALLDLQGKSERFSEVEKVLSLENIKFIQQDPNMPYGNGTPILSAKPYLNEGEPFAMIWGDDMVLPREKGALAQIIDFYQSHECGAVMAVQEVPRHEVSRYGIIKPSEYNEQEKSGVFEYLIEKPSVEEAPSNLVSYGRMVLPYQIFDYLKVDSTGKDHELWLQDANDKLSRVTKFMFKVVDGEWMTTGDPIRYLKAQIKYYLNHPKMGEDTKQLLKELVVD
jgi:UTP--glucose-1-phosphate uridylyltransferase